MSSILRIPTYDFDGVVSVNDFFEILATWGCVGCPGDFIDPPGVDIWDRTRLGEAAFSQVLRKKDKRSLTPKKFLEIARGVLKGR